MPPQLNQDDNCHSRNLDHGFHQQLVVLATICNAVNFFRLEIYTPQKVESVLEAAMKTLLFDSLSEQ